MINLAQIKEVLASSAGQSLREYLISKANELKDITNIKEYSTTSTQTLELKAQLRAYVKLKEILSDILFFDAEVKEKDPRDDYSVE